ncbi:MAG: protease pro-enzyme activation domain-containing protein [Rudaea sp.]|nr:protease pro-enzyme activation domain-containing protein [Rudaea sp.]
MFRNHAFVGALALLCTILSAGTPTGSVEAAGIPAGQYSAAAQTAPKVPPPQPQITQPIDSGKLSAMATNVRPEALVAANDQGAVADDLQMNQMLLLLHRPVAQEQALDQFMAEQTTLGSPNYHNWLTAEQFAQYGLAQSDLDKITKWLTDQQFTVNAVYAGGVMIDFSGTALQVENAFFAGHRQIHNLNVNGVAHIANVSVPQIPSALAPAVVGIVSLNDFRPHTNFKTRDQHPAYTDNTNGYQLVVPADLATIYNLNPLFQTTPTAINGAGQTIVLIEDTNLLAASGGKTDVSVFRSTFGLPATTVLTVHPAVAGNTCSNPGNNSAGGEETLDVEWAGAAAPGATLELASCRDTTTTFGGLIAMQNLLSTAATPTIWSISYGECETANGAAANAAYSSTYQQAAAAGISVFVSSGDESAASCSADQPSSTYGIGVSGFTSTPYNVSVGGTDFGDSYAGTNATYWNATNAPAPSYGSALSYINEIPWNDSCASQLFANFFGFATTYGADGFCNDPNIGVPFFLTTASGSGGPSGCASGNTSVPLVVSGSCAGAPKPAWQSGFLGNPSDGVRDIPDVSLFAANGAWGHFYTFCFDQSAGDCPSPATAGFTFTQDWAGAGGTSFASPIMAGIQALVNQKTASAQGNPNPVYYQLAAAEYGATGSAICNSSLGNAVDPSCTFYDITQGDIDVNCTGPNCYNPTNPDTSNGVLSTDSNSYQPAYGTNTGWDFATGIGSVNAANLVNNWPTSTTPSGLLAFTTEPASSYGAGITFGVQVSVENSKGVVQTTDGSTTVTLTLTTPNGATLNGTTSATDAAGVATFSGLSVNQAGTYTLTATGTNGTTSVVPGYSTQFTISPGAPASMSFTTQPASSANIAVGATIPVAVTVLDQFSNPVAAGADSVTLSLASGPGTLSGTTTASTDANGVATFTGISLASIGTYALAATDGTLSASNANTFNIVASVPTQLVFTTEPANGTAGTAIASVIVTVEDVSGNPVLTDTSTVSLTVSGPGQFANGSVVTATVNGGVATFNSLIFDTAGSGYTLTALDTSDGGLSATSSSFTIAPAAALLVFTTQPPLNIPAGDTLGTVAVQEQDQFGNAINDNTSTVTFSVASCGGTVIGTTTLTGGAGTLDSSQRFYNAAGQQISASTGSASGTSSAFSVVANSDLIFADGLEACRP